MAVKTAKAAGSHLKSRTRKRPEKNKSRSGLIAGVLIVVILLAAVTASGLVVGRNGRIHPNISIFGTDVGGLTVSEAAVLFEKSEALAEGETLTVNVTGGYSFCVNQKDADMLLTPGQAAEVAYGFGHSGNPFEDITVYVKCLLGHFDEKVMIKDASADSLKKLVSEELRELSAILEKGYLADLDAGTLKFIKGAESKLDITELCNEIASAFSEGRSSLDYSIKLSDKPVSPDLDSIHEALFSECVSAEYDSGKDEITESSVGVDFDVNDAQKAWENAKTGELVIIKFKITEPEVTKEKLEKMLFADVLGSYTTNYSFSDENRANNVELAAKKINGVILLPGEEFSYNDVVQKRTAEAGFKEAAAYSGGQVVYELGGGICQVSSTLYCAALYSNLKISARDCHHFLVGYVPVGLDATVSWGGPEFKFVNNREYPIKIVAEYSNDMKLTVEILGTDVDGSYVEMTSREYQCYDDVHTDVAVGYAATTYRNVYDKNGTLLSTEKEAFSYYHYHDEDIVWPEENPVADPEEQPDPIEEQPAEQQGESA